MGYNPKTGSFSFTKIRCSKCGNEFNSAGVGDVCRDCVQREKRVNEFLTQLLKEEFSLERNDEEIARQINSLLIKEGTTSSEEDEKILQGLIEKLIKDGNRKKSIAKEMLKLQKSKG